MHVEPGLELTTSFPNKCRHCNPAPCQATCPTGAIHRPADYPEIVLVEARRCIACGMCAMICPFDAVTYHPIWSAAERPLVAIKCDHCIERQRHAETPACVEACKAGALEFGELNELIKAGRERYSEQVLQATGQGVALRVLEQAPLSIQIWHGWGEAVTGLNANGGRS
jgi:carbon-monoxide dehydrogenase iron sulfur subunit